MYWEQIHKSGTSTVRHIPPATPSLFSYPSSPSSPSKLHYWDNCFRLLFCCRWNKAILTQYIQNCLPSLLHHHATSHALPYSHLDYISSVSLASFRYLGLFASSIVFLPFMHKKIFILLLYLCFIYMQTPFL